MTKNQRLALIIGVIVLAVAVAIAAAVVIVSIGNAQQSYDRSLCIAAGASDCP